MPLKTKLYFSLIFLFLMTLTLSGLGSYFLNQLADNAKAIMEDNYASLEYMHELNSNLDIAVSQLSQRYDESTMANEVKARLDYCQQLIEKQAGNITEPGEEKLSKQLSSQFNTLRADMEKILGKPVMDTAFYIGRILPETAALKETASQIYSLNEETVMRKYEQTNKKADVVITYMSLLGLLGLLVSVAFIIGLPTYLFKPLEELKEGIKQISAQNYEYQLPAYDDDELQEISQAFNLMGQKLSEYEQSNLASVLTEKKRIEAIINHMHEAIIGVNEGHTVLFANQQATEILGLTEKEVKGKHIQSLAAGNDFIKTIASDFALGGPELMEPVQLRIVTKGQEKLYSREIIPISLTRPEDQKPVNVGFVVVLTDITAFTEKDKAKTHFIATISHELKTPITSMIMGLKLLKEGRAGDMNPEQLNLVNSIKDDSDRLLKITGELLKVSQVETGNIQLDIHEFDAQHVAEISVNALNQQALAKGITISQEVSVKHPVTGDMDKTAWVLINFLSNAIRYSPNAGMIKLSLTEENGTVRFSVKDEGPGIEPQFQERLFEKYYRVPGSVHTGTGLGLAISKEFIKAMGGEIGVISSLGMGSEFYFVLPVASKNP